MPQMAPISWLSLFIVFSLILLMFNYLNYFSFFTSTPSISTDTKINQTAMNWKW
uniref:ATP synthase complex subunit 8 n=1 Tax=Caroperla siveci TaxID=2605681 RepID=A0A5B9XWH1_9NEOP|nr:ATP synthase F0 subunit 8 [Caroperla siveci]